MKLSDCFTDLIAYVLFVLKKNKNDALTFDLVNSDIGRLNAESTKKHEATSFSEKDYDLARFAVFAWIDEAILGSDWQEKKTWQHEQLQRRYYQTADAGELFYKYLNSIGPHQNDVREVFYLCLSLGFTGQYCKPGDEFLLEQLKTSNLKLITGSSVDLPSLSRIKLFPESIVENENAENNPVRTGLSVIIYLVFLLPVGLYGLLFLIYKFILSNLGQTIISRL